MLYEVSSGVNQNREKWREINQKYNDLISKTNSPSVARKLMDERDKELEKYKNY